MGVRGGEGWGCGEGRLSAAGTAQGDSAAATAQLLIRLAPPAAAPTDPGTASPGDAVRPAERRRGSCRPRGAASPCSALPLPH